MILTSDLEYCQHHGMTVDSVTAVPWKQCPPQDAMNMSVLKKNLNITTDEFSLGVVNVSEAVPWSERQN